MWSERDWRGFERAALLALVAVFFAGYGCARGCDYVRARWGVTVKVERKP